MVPGVRRLNRQEVRQMTLKKLVMIGAVLATALGAGVSQAKADVVHVNVGPARAHYLPRAPRMHWWGRPYYSRRPVVVAPAIAPVDNYGYGYGYTAPVASA